MMLPVPLFELSIHPERETSPPPFSENVLQHDGDDPSKNKILILEPFAYTLHVILYIYFRLLNSLQFTTIEI